MNYTGFRLLSISLIVLTFAWLAGCGGGTSAPISVTAAAKSPAIDQGQMTSVTATLTNDKSNKGVAWSVSCSVSNCGSVSPTKTTSGVAATYTAPANAASVTIKATSVADTSKSASASVTVNATPTGPSGTTNAPAATVGQPYSFDVSTLVTGGTSPFTCAITSGTLPNGLSRMSATSCVISGTPASPARTKILGASRSGTALAAGDPSATVTFTVTDSGNPPVSVQITVIFTVKAAALAISPATLPGGTVGVMYSQTVTVSGGTPPYATTVTGLPADGLTATVSTDGSTITISGTPASAQTVTVTVSTTDSTTPTAQTASVTYSIIITVSTACTPSQTTLCGQFTFLAQGSPGTTNTPLMIAGTFTADGNGGITAGVLDFNSDSTGALSVNITPVATTAWSVGTDGRGTITLTTSSAINGTGSVKFTFALNSTGTFALIFESDDTNGTGLHQSGYMQAADKTKFNAASITGGYALGLVGGDGAGSIGRPRAAMLAAVSASGSDCGLTSNGNSVFIVHDQGMFNTTPIPFTCTTGGLSTIDATTGRGTVQITFTGSPFSPQVMNFAFYLISATKVIFISTDAAGANFAILSGTMYQQAKSSFSGSDVACGFAPDTNSGCVFLVSGESGKGSHITAGRSVGTAVGATSATLTVSFDDNKAGGFRTVTNLAGWTVSISANGLGTIVPPAGSTESPAGFVAIDTDTAVMGIIDGAEQVGLIKPQTATGVSTAAEAFILGTQLVGDGKVPNVSGVVTLATPTAGNLAGTLDVQLVVSPFEISGAAFTGTYALDSPATGRGTGTSTSPGPSSFIIWVVGPNEVVVLESDSTNPDPVLIDLMKQ